MSSKLSKDFYTIDAVALAKNILGKILVRKFEDGTTLKFKITEVEAYCGEDDLACHASKGRTKRTEIMYHEGGKVYVYLIYGMYWMLNVVSGKENEPQAVLIRGLENISGPGRVGKALKLDRSFYGEDLLQSERIWIEKTLDSAENLKINTSTRIGIEYSGDIWSKKPWRFYL